MKNKKSLLSLGILALILVLGVGYAVVSGQNLTINGTATTAEEFIDVYFSSAKVLESSSDVTASVGNIVASDKPITATLTVSNLSAIGDYATFNYTVANDEKDLAAEVKMKEIKVLSNENEDLKSFYTVTTSVDTTATTVPNSDGSTSGTADITVTVSLAKLPITDDESTANITITLDATPVQPTTP